MSKYHRILGVADNAPSQEIDKAYRRKAFACHPDRRPEHERKQAHNEFVQVQEAYQQLTKGTLEQRTESSIPTTLTDKVLHHTVAAFAGGTPAHFRTELCKELCTEHEALRASFTASYIGGGLLVAGGILNYLSGGSTGPLLFGAGWLAEGYARQRAAARYQYWPSVYLTGLAAATTLALYVAGQTYKTLKGFSRDKPA
ncbi:J domain-containing protein [Candidatus Woesearchaeota archaeon]|nr:J domain-containing protein [Candidatus Woesearchaeota archaeon]